MNTSFVARLRAGIDRISLRHVGLLALATAALTAGLITYGAWVRVSGSGLGCPDWPLCNGGVLPGGGRSAVIEYGHRLFAGLTMILVVVTAFFGFQRRHEAPRPVGLLIVALILIFGQAALGGVAVLTHLHRFVVFAHLGVAMGVIGLLTAGGLAILEEDRHGSARRLAPQLLALLGVGTVLLGASIVATDTGFLCPDVPFCQGRSTSMATWLHTIHRTLGIVLLMGLLAAGLSIFWSRTSGAVLMLVVALILLVVAQAGVGVATVQLTLPEGLRVLHVGLATLIWWGLVGLWALWPKDTMS